LLVNMLVLLTPGKEILSLQSKPCRPVTHNLNYSMLVSVNTTQASVTAVNRHYALCNSHSHPTLISFSIYI
jgi:hypothetical protein